MIKTRVLLLPAILLSAMGCDLETAELSDFEGRLIYSRMVGQVSQELTAAAEGPVSSTVPCPVGGEWSMEGSVVGSSVDRGWDVETTASACGIGGQSGDEEAGLTISSSGVQVFQPQPDDTTPFSASGTVSWTRTVGSGSGSCIIDDDTCQENQ